MTEPARETLHQQRSRETRDAILRAAVICLDENGYAETTFAKVQQAAGMSRGAITHHFPTRQALVAETAQRLLDNVMRPFHRDGPQPVVDMVLSGWKTMLDNREGRAFVEILVACRTDAVLRDTLAEALREFDTRIGAAINQAYKGAQPEPDDAALLWAIFRSFCRGLIIHQQFVSSPKDIDRMLTRFARMMEREMGPRDTG
ncbi:MAG: TetR/AcrR family transcriptional regulator [Paracoccaceae bacterium]